MALARSVGMNLSSISNPHLIFPGQVLYLVRSNGYARLSSTAPSGDSGVVRLSPQARESSLSDLALPTLPHLIEPSWRSHRWWTA